MIGRVHAGSSCNWKKTVFENLDPIDATTTVPQYLGRRAAHAATIINAREYGRTIHDLATRRQLILIGEDLVNAAYDSPVDFPPRDSMESGRLRNLQTIRTRRELAQPACATR